MRAGKKLQSNLRYKGLTFSELATDAVVWSEEHHPKDIRTVRSRMKKLTAEFGLQSAGEIDANDLDQWLSAQQKWAPATKNRYRALLSLVFRQAIRNGKLTENPARLVAPRLENNARTRYLLDHEELELRKAIHARCPQNEPALDVALNTGIRKGEQFSLTWSAIDLNGKKITLVETKNGSSRVVPINAACLKALESLRKRKTDRTDRVFLTSTGEPTDDSRMWFEAVMDDAKIKGFRWHDLRHTFCSRMAMAGVDIRTIAALAGHKTLQMSMRYSHLAPEHNLAAIEKLSPVRL